MFKNKVPACCDTDAVKAIEDQNERIWLPLTPTIPKDSAESLENRGIRLCLGTVDDLDQVVEHFNSEFVPDEPCSRSLEVFSKEAAKSFPAQAVGAMTKCFLKDILENGKSVLALDGTGKIMGMFLGRAVGSTDKKDDDMSGVECGFRVGKKYPRFIGRKAMLVGLRYEPHLVMEDVKCGKVYCGDILSVAGECRGIGLGKVLLLHSLRLAEDEGCEAYFAALTGLYSQRIFEKMEFQLLREIEYSSLKDHLGQAVISDAGEHKSVKAMYKRLNLITSKD